MLLNLISFIMRMLVLCDYISLVPVGLRVEEGLDIACVDFLSLAVDVRKRDSISIDCLLDKRNS